jgi:nucleotide-binding universal stress UspA family protein
VVTQVVRGRSPGRAIVEEGARIKAQVIMIGIAPKRRIGDRFFGRTVDYVLRNSPCRVIVSCDPRAGDAPAVVPPSAAATRTPS